MHIVFIDEWYAAADPTQTRLSEMPGNMEYAFDSTGMGSWSAIYCDAEFIMHNGKRYDFKGKSTVDMALIDLCKQTNPNILIFSPLKRNSLPPNPDRLTLSYIAWKMKIPIVGILWDVGPESIHMMDKYYPMLTHCIAICPDPVSVPHMSKKWSSDWFLPINESYCYSTAQERDPCVTIPGRLHGMRKDIVDILSGAGISVRTTEQDRLIPYEEYCNILRRALITLGTANNRMFHGKSFEAPACGSLLFEPDNAITKLYYTPHEEYIPYELWTDTEDNDTTKRKKDRLVDQIHYFMANQNEAKEIANRARIKTHRQYTASKYWEKLIKIVLGGGLH